MKYSKKTVRKVYKKKVPQSRLKYKFRRVKTVASVQKVVKNIMSKNEETKLQQWNWELTPLCLQSTTGTLANNYMILNPSSSVSGLGYGIARGTGSGQMVGDKIRVKSAILNYIFTLVPGYNATTNPQPGKPMQVRLYFYKWKRQPQNDPQLTNLCGTGINANFFELGTSDIGFVGNLGDMLQKINSNQYTYLGHKDFKLGNSIPANGPVGIGSPQYIFSNNDFKMSAIGKLNITKYFNKTLSRDDNGDWMDSYLIGLIQYVYADGTIATNASAPLRVETSIMLSYTDA